MQKEPKTENPWINLIFNLVLPVFILNKLTGTLGPVPALLLALAFPLGYGLWDLWTRKKTNMFSVLGILNTGITGGFALSGLTGNWFALKEAAFPLLIGIFVFASASSRKPFVETLFLNPQVFQIDLIREKIESLGKQQEFRDLLRQSTRWLALSFFLSATLNYVLAIRIFEPLDETLTSLQRDELLNSQIAQMTQWSMPVIMVPSILFLMGILYLLIARLRGLTGLSSEQLMKLR